MHWHADPIDVVLARLDTPARGLSDSEVIRRRAQFGWNELPPPARVSALTILLQQFTSVVVWLLVAAIVVSLFLGDHVDALAIAVVLAINTIIGFVMEWRARRAMQALLQRDAVRAIVVRDGQARLVHAREVVPGDIIELGAGRQVPADARLLESADLRTSEAALTGESLPVSKHAELTLLEDTPLGDRRNMVYSGTTVMSGVAHAIVIATGRTTEIGTIGELVGQVQVEPTPLERRLDALGRRLVWLAFGVAALVAALGALQGIPAGLLAQTGIALAVAAVPEALPVVATIALAVGMKRMAARQAIVRRLTSVESLGSTTVVCTDKTRTLTSGEMRVVRTWTPGSERELLEVAALATPLGVGGHHDSSEVTDPVDGAVLAAARASGIDPNGLRRSHAPAGLIPFSSERKFMATFHAQRGEIIASLKGAPVHVLERCHLTAGAHDAAIRINDEMAGSGLRVLAVAQGAVAAAAEDALRALRLVGFIGLADPPARGVAETVARLRGAGLRTVMVTGDQSLTAQAIGREVGVIGPHEDSLDGRQLDALDDDGLREAVGTTAVFSRITPEHKLRIVSALQARGEIVAMLGDGVNDAPALRKADVGVAMGIRGTDAAKEAAAIVLSDDRFDTIAAAVEEGRVIFDNIQKFVLYLFSCNLAEVLVLLCASAAGWPLPLLPLQLLWLNMVTDTFPALALSIEPAERDVMRRPPRHPDEAILSRRFVTSIALYASLITVAASGAFAWALWCRPGAATTMAFMTLALAQIAHLGNARSVRSVLAPQQAFANRYAIGGAALAVGLQLTTVFVDPLARVLQVVPLDVTEWLMVLAMAALPAAIGQVVKTRRPHL